MPAYTFANINAGSQQNITTTPGKSAISIVAATGAATLRRGWVMEWEIGADGVPNSTDCPIVWRIGVITAAGTSTALTPIVNDIGGGDAVAQLTYGSNHTVEPTYTASQDVWYLPLNQRASYRIQMRDEWSAIIIPAVNAKGVGFRAFSPNYASTIGVRGLIRE